MESVEDRTIKLSCLPLFPQSLEIAKERRFHTLPPHDYYWVYTDISNGRNTLSFLSSTNMIRPRNRFLLMCIKRCVA
jgi:hypothetical protein